MTLTKLEERAAKAREKFLALSDEDARAVLLDAEHPAYAADEIDRPAVWDEMIAQWSVKDLEQSMGSRRRVRWLKWIVVIAAVLLLVFLLGRWLFGGSDTASAEEPLVPAGTGAPAIVSEGDDPFKKCVAGHSGGKVIDSFKAGLEAVAAKAKDNNGVITPEIGRDTLLSYVACDRQVAAIYGHEFGVSDVDPEDWQTLSEEAHRAIYYRLEGRLLAAKATRGEAPANGTNSGIEDGTFGVAEEPGISGDRTATQFTFPEEAGLSPMWVMDRCANIVYVGTPPVYLPKVKTDNPPSPTPTPTVKPTPTPTTPGRTLAPKNPSKDSVRQGNAVTGGGKNRTGDGGGSVQKTPPPPSPAKYTPPASPKPVVPNQPNPTTKPSIPAGTPGGGPTGPASNNDGGHNDGGGGGTQQGGNPAGSGEDGNGTVGGGNIL